MQSAEEVGVTRKGCGKQPMQEKYLWLAGKIKKGEIVMEGHRKIKLLLADDSITIRRVVEMTLPQDKFQITSVGDGESALEALENERPDVLLADVIMPKMDGYALCSVIRSSPQFKDIPVILLVGTFENYDEARGKDCGANDHIVKPFETGDLIDKIRRVTESLEESTTSAEAPPVAADENVMKEALEAALEDTCVQEEVSMERGDHVEFTERESEQFTESSAAGIVEPFATLSEIPGHHEYCEEAAPGSEPQQEVAAEVAEEVVVAAAVSEEAEPDAGDESFPWEEDMDLPVSEEEEPPTPAEVPVTEEVTPAATEEEHVFSVNDFKAEVLEALEKGEEIEEAVPAEETVSTVPAVPAAETAEAVPSSPAVLSGDVLCALQESIEKSVHNAVLSAFGDYFREAVEKAAREVVPGIVEKLVKEELDKRGG